MPSYSQEKKDEILAMMERDGVTKTFEETRIARATLYKWRNEAKKNAGEPSLVKKTSRKKKAVTDSAVPMIVSQESSSEAALSNADNDMAAIKQALLEDAGLHDKVMALEAENAKLRKTVCMLKNMLLAAIDG